MWTKIINYKSFVRYGVQMGAKVVNSQHHTLNALLLGERRNHFIFRLDKMLLSYFSNKKLINKMSFSGAHFLFLTSREEYYDTLRLSADKCQQGALAWRASAIGNLNTRGEVLEELYGEECSPSVYLKYFNPDVFVLFDNEKFRSERLLNELNRFPGIPLFSVMDTDSIVNRTMFPITGNDDSSLSLYFYSFFVAHCIVSAKKGFDHQGFDYDKKLYE